MPVYAPTDDFGAIRGFPGVRKWPLGMLKTSKNDKKVKVGDESLSICLQGRFRNVPGHPFGRFGMDLGWLSDEI